MIGDYVSLSLETHLFFGRIMKEHSLFLMAGFPAKNADYIKRADWFREQFEELLREVVELARGRVGNNVLSSGEIVTEYTFDAERRTSFLTGIEIDSRITAQEKALAQEDMSGCRDERNRRIAQLVRQINRKALRLTDGLMEFKEKVLKDMAECCLFTFNYHLLVEHILREAGLYRRMIAELERRGTLDGQSVLEMENFWNRIMMEHALFIRGLLDPTEENLIDTADNFADEYKALLKEAKEKDCMATGELSIKSLKETERYRDFKAAGTKGITEFSIAGLILPLLADHVLREANHYLRLLKEVPATEK